MDDGAMMWHLIMMGGDGDSMGAAAAWAHGGTHMNMSDAAMRHGGAVGGDGASMGAWQNGHHPVAHTHTPQPTVRLL